MSDKGSGVSQGSAHSCFFGGCGGLRTGPQVLQYQPGSLLAWLLEIFTQKRWKGRSYCEHRNVFFFLEPVWLRQWTLGWVLRAASLLPICWQALATVKWYRFKLNDIITSRQPAQPYGSHCWQELHSITNVSLGLPHELHLLFCPGIAKHEADHHS